MQQTEFNIFKIKSIDLIQQDADRSEQSLRRSLGPVQITLMGVGGIIGAGIFATIGTAAAGDLSRPGAGPGLVLSFAMAALVCVFVALCYAEFASMVPISGSAYTYSYATMGEIIAWVIGWDLIIEYAVGNVAVAISWANYFKTFLAEAGILVPDWLSTDFNTATKIPGLLDNAPHIFGIPIVFNLLAFSIIAVITVILLIGIRESAWFNTGMVIIKLLVLAFFVYVGVQYVHVENWHPFLPNGWRGLASGAAVIFFAYIGFDAVSTLAEEAKKPKRDLPVGIIGSLVICTLIYIIIAAVFTGIIPYHALAAALSTQQAEPLTLALQYVHLKGFVIYVVALGSVVAHTAVLFVFQLGQPRIFFSMARDGLLPGVFSRVHPRFRTPWGSTLLTGFAVGTASMFTSLEEMVDLTNIGTLFAFILVCAGVIILRKSDPERERPFRVPGGMLMPLLGVLGCIGMIAYLPPTSWLRFAAWLNIGFIIYAGYGILHSRLTGFKPGSKNNLFLLKSALSGGWLGVIGTVMLLVARMADIFRESKNIISGLVQNHSLWLTIPLLLNLLILYPMIFSRIYKVVKSDRELKKSPVTKKAIYIIVTMCVATSAYLLTIYVL